MVPVIIGLLLIGGVLVLASFIFGGSLSDKSDKGMMTEEQIEQLVERRFHEAKYKLDDEAEKSADQIKDQTERELEKLSNEKIMAVNEYSDQVMDQINKNHNEVLFLYSMLSDKQKELDNAVERLNLMKQQTENEERLANNRKNREQKQETADKQESATTSEEDKSSDAKKQETVSEDASATELPLYRSKEEIMKMHASGMSSLEIAQKLQLGIGEVRLVLELSKER